MLNIQSVFAIFMVLIVLPISILWAARQLYNDQRIKTREVRRKDLTKLIVFFVAWLLITTVIDLILSRGLGFDLVFSAGVIGAALLAVLSLLGLQPTLRRQSIAVMSSLLLAIVIYAFLGRFSS